MTTTENNQQKTTNTFELNAPDAKEVFLVGDFNDWKVGVTPMKRRGANWFEDVGLSAGRHEYKFVVDGKWCCEPGCGDRLHSGCKKCVPNAFGTMNRFIDVG